MRSKIILTLTLLLALPAVTFVGCGRGVDLEITQKFQAAQQAFDTAATPEDFTRVARKYDEILRRGVTSGAILYNQGNAWVNAGRPGRAIAAYRQAQRYRPTDPFLAANLQSVVGNVETRRPVVEHIFFWQNWLSYPAKFTLAAFAAIVTFMLGIAALFVYPKVLNRLAIAGLVLTAILVVSAGYDWYRFDGVTHGVVDAGQVVVRKGYGDNFEPALTEPIAEGTEFRVVKSRGDWLHIRLPGGLDGWIPEAKAVTY